MTNWLSKSDVGRNKQSIKFSESTFIFGQKTGTVLFFCHLWSIKWGRCHLNSFLVVIQRKDFLWKSIIGIWTRIYKKKGIWTLNVHFVQAMKKLLFSCRLICLFVFPLKPFTKYGNNVQAYCLFIHSLWKWPHQQLHIPNFNAVSSI